MCSFCLSSFSISLPQPFTEQPAERGEENSKQPTEERKKTFWCHELSGTDHHYTWL